MNNKVIDINKKCFLSVLVILGTLILLSIVITYVIPKGAFGTTMDEYGNAVIDYTKYEMLDNQKGINIFKGLFSFILVLFSGDGLSIIMLCVFLLIISATFQVMNDTNGMKVIISKLINKFKNSKKLLLALVTLIFMMFGSFFGLFEEVLTLLPIIIILCISMGYDSYTAFLVCIVACGFGFASAITNPFTVVTASNIIGASIVSNIWFRILIFLIMYGLMMLFILHHVKVISNKPESSPTYESDLKRKDSLVIEEDIKNTSTIYKSYLIFLIFLLVSIITITSIEALRSYTVVFLIVIFLVGGLIAGYVSSKNFKQVIKSFGNGIINALPTIIIVLMASSIKYILEEGNILATIINTINKVIEGRNIFVIAIILYFIILFLEFFISSSTAKAIFIMGILSCVSIDLSKECLVLIYLFGDGFTNVLFPTSPVLLIALSMINMNYLTWVKKSKYLFLINLLLVIGLIMLAIVIKY